MQVRELTNVWAKSTWAEQLDALSADSELTKRLKTVLKSFELFGQRIDGNSVLSLPRSAEGNFPKGMNISYTKAFDLAYREDAKKLPLLYLLNMAKAFDFKTYSTRQFEGLVARGLRTFPSLLRDRDYAESLNRLLTQKGYKDFEIGGASPEEDIGKHTDVLLKFKNRLFRIWLYQFSFAGLPHDMERVLGRRGQLPDGIHVLCPLKATIAMKQETLQKRQVSYAERLKKKRERLKGYSNMSCIGAIECRQDLRKLEEMISKNDSDLKAVNDVAEREIITLNAWYFFADQNVLNVIDRIVAISEGKIKADDYAKVCEVLTGPEKYLGEIRLFLVNA
jgi:hypothetical protein